MEFPLRLAVLPSALMEAPLGLVRIPLSLMDGGAGLLGAPLRFRDVPLRLMRNPASLPTVPRSYRQRRVVRGTRPATFSEGVGRRGRGGGPCGASPVARKPLLFPDHDSGPELRRSDGAPAGRGPARRPQAQRRRGRPCPGGAGG